MRLKKVLTRNKQQIIYINILYAQTIAKRISQGSTFLHGNQGYVNGLGEYLRSAEGTEQKQTLAAKTKHDSNSTLKYKNAS